MDILTEQAPTYDECIARITQKYGPNIQILRQKTVRIGGFLGLFEKEAIELSFMLLRESYRYAQSPAPTSRKPAADFDEERKKLLREAAKTAPAVASRVGTYIDGIDRKVASADVAPRAATGNGSSGSVADKDSVETILRALKNIDVKLSRQGENPESAPREHEAIGRIGDLLEQNDFSSAFVRLIQDRLRNEFSLGDLDDFDRVQDTVVEWIGSSIIVNQSETSSRPRVIALVGPTGVGKTTTVAKLAASFHLGASKGSRPLNVRIITIDNYRIGAKQQIEIYGNIMGIPVSCAETALDLKKLIDLYQDADIILIDTIGKSPKDYSRIAEQRHFLDSAGPISDIHLAMSASTKASDMREIMQQYETFGYGSVIITKFDETTRVGNIVSVLQEKNKPVAYITTGQRVPQDFEKATVVRFLTNLDGFRVNRARIEELFPPDNSRFEWR